MKYFKLLKDYTHHSKTELTQIPKGTMVRPNPEKNSTNYDYYVYDSINNRYLSIDRNLVENSSEWFKQITKEEFQKEEITSEIHNFIESVLKRGGSLEQIISIIDSMKSKTNNEKPASRKLKEILDNIAERKRPYIPPLPYYCPKKCQVCGRDDGNCGSPVNCPKRIKITF